MEWIITWIRNIVCLYLILSVIFQLLPEVEEKKYIQFFGNVLITLCLLRPILQLGNLGERLEQNVISNVLEESFEDMMRQIDQKEVVGASYVEKACKEELRVQIAQWMQVYGYDLIACDIEFWEGDTLEWKDLQIKVKHTKEEDTEKDKKSEEEFLKKELINVYKIPEGNINITIQG